MKGLMLTLMLTWTGMVMAQQDNRSGFNSSEGTSPGFRVENERERPLVPIVNSRSSRFGAVGNNAGQDQNDRARTAFGTQRRTAEMLGPAESGATGSTVRPGAEAAVTQTSYHALNPEFVTKLVNEGSLRKPIDALESRRTHRITISNQNSAKPGSVDPIRGRLIENDLVFQVNSNQLRDINERSLEFDVPEYMRGRYNQIVIEYPPTLSRIAVANQSPMRSAEPPEPGNNRWTIAGEKNPNTSAMLPIPRRDEEDRFASLPSRNLKNTGLLTNQEEERRQRALYDQRLAEERERQQILAEENRRLRAEKLDLINSVQQRGLSDEEYEYQQRLAKSRLTPQRLRESEVPSRPATDPGFAALVNEINDLKRQNMETQIDLAKVQGQNDFLTGKLRAVSYEDPDAMTQRRNLFNDTDHQNRIVDRRPSVPENAPVSDTIRRSREQNQLNMGAGFDLSDNTTSDADTSKSTRKNANNPTDMMLFILLLMSVALNLYLWWLSRTFHSRYQELADELRETFTATV